MRKLLMLGIAVISLGAAAPAIAQSNDDAEATVGATAGGAAGGTLGFLIGGPIGAIVGGFAGAVIGGEAAVSPEVILYAGENPVEPVYLDTEITVGYEVGSDITVYPIEGDDQFGYFYANNRVFIVDMETMTVVQSPGFLIPEDAVAFVEANPTASVEFEGELAAGVALDSDIQIAAIPAYPDYGYVYVQDRPALVDLDSRMVVWVR
jgi:hypothetical protein